MGSKLNRNQTFTTYGLELSHCLNLEIYTIAYNLLRSLYSTAEAEVNP